MIQSKKRGPITIYKMGRNIGCFVPIYTHSFLIEETLIDTGMIYAQDEFMSEIKNTHIKVVINTHHHEDHIGNNHMLQEVLGVTIYAHPKALYYLENPREIKLKFHQRVVFNWPKASRGQPIPDVIRTPTYSLQVITTPGHSFDHVCLYEPDKKWLFSGDIYCGKKVVYMGKNEDFNLILESLKKLVKLDIKTLFCNFKGVVEEGCLALNDKIDYMTNLKENVFALYKQGVSPRKIRKKLLGKEDIMFYFSKGHYSKQNVIGSILKGQETLSVHE